MAKEIEDIELKRKKLEEATEKLRDQLSDDVKEKLGIVERGLLSGLVIGGTSYVTYKFIKRLLKKKKKSKSQGKNDDEGSVSEVVKGLLEVGALLLLASLRDQLVEYISKADQENKENESQDL